MTNPKDLKLSQDRQILSRITTVGEGNAAQPIESSKDSVEIVEIVEKVTKLESKVDHSEYMVRLVYNMLKAKDLGVGMTLSFRIHTTIYSY